MAADTTANDAAMARAFADYDDDALDRLVLNTRARVTGLARALGALNEALAPEDTDLLTALTIVTATLADSKAARDLDAAEASRRHAAAIDKAKAAADSFPMVTVHFARGYRPPGIKNGTAYRLVKDVRRTIRGYVEVIDPKDGEWYMLSGVDRVYDADGLPVAP